MAVNIEQVRETKHNQTVKVDPVMEAIAKKLSGIENLRTLDGTPQERLRVSRTKHRYIKNAVKAGRDAVMDEVEALRKENAELVHFYHFYKKFVESTQYLGHCNGYTEKQAYNDMRDIAEGDLFKLFDAMQYPEVIAKMRQFFDCEECGGTGIGTPTPEMERNCPECHGYGTTIVKDVAYKNEQYEQFLMREGLQEEFQDFVGFDEEGNDGNE